MFDPMRKQAGLLASPVTIGCLVLVMKALAEDAEPAMPRAPELVGITEWINSKPLSLEGLKGKVVVLHFWTFSCINCQHNLPFYNHWQADFRDQIQIVGVHTPETSTESELNNVSAQVKDL